MTSLVWCGQVARVEGEGYYGGVRLLMAICKVFHAYCEVRGIILHDRNFTLSYDTNVPRQVSCAEAVSALGISEGFFVMCKVCERLLWN